MNVSIDHPTDRSNFTEVTVGDITIWFSYRTAVGFMAPGWGRVVRENEWSNTTGRHLNYIDDGRKSSRVSGHDFDIMLDCAMAGETPEQSLGLHRAFGVGELNPIIEGIDA